MLSRIGAREARTHFADLLGRVGYGGDTVIVERSGKPLAVLISVELYEALMAERRARFAVVQRMRDNAPTVAEEELQRDVEQAIRETRAVYAARRT